MSQQADRRERLQKVLAAAGVASRRACEELIRAGRVSVNGRIIRELGVRVDRTRDRVRVDGRMLAGREPRRYYLLHKPRGVVSTTRDPHARRTVVDLTSSSRRLFPVGRLDSASEGLLLLTNDGELAQHMLHPSFRVPRTYRVTATGKVGADALRALRQGVQLDECLAAAEDVRLVRASDSASVVEVVLIEGRRHQIRRMFDSIGHPVRRLIRVGFGPLSLRGLAPGECRPLQRDERAALEQLVRRRGAGRRVQPSGSARQNFK